MIAVLLSVLEVGYFRLAARFNIIDKPNQRSSHSSVVLRGGGVIFLIPDTPFAHWLYLTGALVALGVVYVMLMKKFYHLHEEYLSSLKKDGFESHLSAVRRCKQGCRT